MTRAKGKPRAKRKPRAPASAGHRVPLSRERVLRAAIALADQDGIGSLTMRKLGQVLGVEAMSLYNHVANKDDILNGIVDEVLNDIDVPASGTNWRTAMRGRSISAHHVFLAHPWAVMLLMSRYNIGPGMTRYLDATLGRLREGGFSIDGALDAWHTLDSHLYGFTLQELNLPFDIADSQQVSADVLPQIPADDYPHVTEVITKIMRTGRTEDLEFGLDLILDGLERALAKGPDRAGQPSKAKTKTKAKANKPDAQARAHRGSGDELAG